MWLMELFSVGVGGGEPLPPPLPPLPLLLPLLLLPFSMLQPDSASAKAAKDAGKRSFRNEYKRIDTGTRLFCRDKGLDALPVLAGFPWGREEPMPRIITTQRHLWSGEVRRWFSPLQSVRNLRSDYESAAIRLRRIAPVSGLFADAIVVFSRSVCLSPDRGASPIW